MPVSREMIMVTRPQPNSLLSSGCFPGRSAQRDPPEAPSWKRGPRGRQPGRGQGTPAVQQGRQAVWLRAGWKPGQYPPPGAWQVRRSAQLRACWQGLDCMDTPGPLGWGNRWAPLPRGFLEAAYPGQACAPWQRPQWHMVAGACTLCSGGTPLGGSRQICSHCASPAHRRPPLQPAQAQPRRLLPSAPPRAWGLSGAARSFLTPLVGGAESRGPVCHLARLRVSDCGVRAVPSEGPGSGATWPWAPAHGPSWLRCPRGRGPGFTWRPLGSGWVSGAAPVSVVVAVNTVAGSFAKSPCVWWRPLPA